MNPNQDVQAKILNCAIDTDAARIVHTYDRDLKLLVRSAASSIVVDKEERNATSAVWSGVDCIVVFCVCMT